jgi:FkbM family methyltransferase
MHTRLRYLYRAYRYRWRVDPAELKFICRRLRPGQVAVDVGCHKGAYTYWMRRRVGPTGSVVAFEPQPQQVDYLRGVFAAMGYRNVALEPKALSDAPGRLPLYIPIGPGLTHAASLVRGKAEHGPCQAIEVEVTTFDATFANCPRGPDLVKIDVEGQESAVLAGARQTLQTYRPTLLVECEVRHRPDGNVRPVFEFLHSLGYEGSFFLAGRRLPLARFDPAVHQRLDPVTGRPAPGYANNFAFEHSTRT